MNQTNRISSFFPSASAYLCSDCIEGHLPLQSPLSRRATADWLVLMRCATSSWLSPEESRNSRIRRNSSSSCCACRKPLRKTGSCICSSSVSSNVFSGLFIFKLQFPCNRNFEFLFRSFLRFFHKTVQHDDHPANLCAVKNAANSLLPGCANFKQSVSHRTCMGHSQIWPENLHSIQKCKRFLANGHWQAYELLTCIFIGKFNRVRIFIRT